MNLAFSKKPYNFSLRVKIMKILFTGGGTAGHIFPIIAVAREIKKIYPANDLQLFYVGPRDEFSEELLSGEGFTVKTIFAGKIRRYLGLKPFFQNLLDIFFKMPIGFFQAFFHVFLISPDLIFSKGGYGSFSVVFLRLDVADANFFTRIRRCSRTNQ